MTWTAPDVYLPDGPLTGDDRPMLEGFLDWHRALLRRKCAGLTGEQLAERSVPPSNLSLLGLVRHMAKVERTWFRERIGDQELEPIYYPDLGVDADFEDLDPDRAQADYERLLEECRLAAEALAAASYDDTITAHGRHVRALRGRAHDRGVRPAQRSRRPAARAGRRHDRQVAVLDTDWQRALDLHGVLTRREPWTDALKPLTSSQIGRISSNNPPGTTKIAPAPFVTSIAPNMSRMQPTKSTGYPTSARTARKRGTSRDRYRRNPKIVPPTAVTRYSTTMATS